MEEIIKSDLDTLFENEYNTWDTNQHFDLIVKYYQSLDEEGKTYFHTYIFSINYTVERITSSQPIKVKWFGLLFIRVLIYLWTIEYWIDECGKIKWSSAMYSLLISYKEILSCLSWNTKNLYAKKLSVMILNLNLTSNFQLKDLQKDILGEILSWRVWNIELKVNQVDVEIHSDQNEVVKLIKEFGFGSVLNEYLTDLSSKNIMEEDYIAFAWTINTFREFFWSMMYEISDKIVEITGTQLWDYFDDQNKRITTSVWIARKHIKDKLQLSDKDNALINKYMDIVHDEGWHNMFSSQTYFRLTKNIGIEILYMLLSKLKELGK